MTQKLSGSTFVNEFNIDCVPTTFKETFTDYRLKVFSINPVNIIDYPEGINATSSDILYELHHTFLTTNSQNWEPPFDEGNDIQLYGFVEIDKTVEPPVFISSVPLTGTFKIIKSSTSSTIVKLLAGVTNEISELGFMYYAKPYRMKVRSTLECIIPEVVKPTVTVNFDTLELSWSPNSSYTIEVGDGFVNHLYGEQYGNPSFTVPFTTNANPSVSEYYPTTPTESFNWHKANKLIQLTYTNSPMLKNAGNIKLYQVNATGPDTLLTTFTLPGDPRVTLNSNTYKIDINSLGYIKENSTYYLTIDDGTFKDYDGFQAVGVSDSNTIRFETDEVHFPGFKSAVSVFSALNDIGLRLRRNSVVANAVASLSAIAGRYKVAFSNQASSFTISSTLLRLRRFITSLNSNVTVSINSTNSRKRGFRAIFNASAFTVPMAKFIDYILINSSSTITDPTTSAYTYQATPSFNGFPGKVRNNNSYIVSSAVSDWVFQPSYSSAGENNFGKGIVYIHSSADNSLVRTFPNPDPAPGYAASQGASPGAENLNKIRVFGESLAIYNDLLIISGSYYYSLTDPQDKHKIFVYSISSGSLITSFVLPNEQTYNSVNEISCNGSYITITTDDGYYIYQVSDYSLALQNTTDTLCTGRLYGNYFVFNSGGASAWKLTVYNITTQAVLYTKGIAQVGPGWTSNGTQLFLSKWDGTTDSQYINVYTLSTGALIGTIDKHQGDYLRQTTPPNNAAYPMYLYPTIYFATASTVFASVDVYPTSQGAIPSPNISLFGYNISTGILTHAIPLPVIAGRTVEFMNNYCGISGNQVVINDDAYQATPSSPYGRLLRYTVPN